MHHSRIVPRTHESVQGNRGPVAITTKILATQPPIADRRLKSATKPPANSNTITCYECGNPGVFRRNCPQCNKRTTEASTLNVQFCALDINAVDRPAVQIQINGMTGIVFLDSGPNTSLASSHFSEPTSSGKQNWCCVTERLRQLQRNRGWRVDTNFRLHTRS